MNIKETFRANPMLVIMRNVPMDITIDYAQSAYDGGVRMFEVALNSKNGLEQIAMLVKHFAGKAHIGAGTAITTDKAKAALDAGAEYLLTPSAPLAVLDYCAKNKVPFLPGVLTPTDVGSCLEFGFDTLKLFPAGDMPRGYVRSLKGPFDNTEYVAIGGVSPDNIGEFFKAGYLGAGMGSNLYPKEIVEQKQWDRATEYLREKLAKAKNS